MALSADSLFFIPQFPDPGNCEGRDMDTVVTEAYTLTQNAIDVLNILIEDNVPLTPQNIIFAETAYTLWGSEVDRFSDSTFTLTSEGQSILNLAKCKL
jgi:hypothetical protein